MANINTDGFCYPTAESLYKILLLRNMECVNYYVTRKQNAYKNTFSTIFGKHPFEGDAPEQI